MEINQEVIDWLLKQDPSIVFQTKRDLLELSESEWYQDRQNITKYGWGKKLLELQQPSGRWGVEDNDKDFKYGKGIYGPKYISTTYTLLLLRRLEMMHNNQIHLGCGELLKSKYVSHLLNIDHDLHTPSSKDNPKDLCIPAIFLGIMVHFDFGKQYYDRMLKEIEICTLNTGGWNCRSQKDQAVKHFSVHTTINVLEALALIHAKYPQYRKRIKEITDPAHEALLIHELYKSHRTKETIHPSFIDITFPQRYRYNILGALDYFQSINFPYDERMEDALTIVRNKSNKGFWNKGTQFGGLIHFSLDVARQPSAFNTLRALRVLKKYSD
ncbi:MAG: hypothetical protein INQ03_20365 [Candidatus Heimdallarchaeota archaeon]|nr:hypothetical protein [Candidatus Heimdallarchaeota archaeon]